MVGPFIDATSFHPRNLTEGVTARLVSGERIMLSEVTIEANGVVPQHRHPHEQAGVCLNGEFDLEVDGEVRRIKAGDYYLIPGGTVHAARGVGSRAVTLDIFSPPREDYLPGAEPKLRS